MVRVCSPQVEREHRPLLSGLLQPLEALSTGYPETELSALSGDLRVCVATLGAVWSAEMRGAAEGGRVGMASAVLSGLQQGRDGEEKKCEENQQTRVDEGLKYGKEVGEDKSKCKLVEEIPDALQSSQPASAQTKHLLHQEEDAYQTAFQKALKEAQDPEIPVKGHGLASLSRLIDANDREASDNSLLLLRVFKENLHHPDSYVYLSAIRGLVKLASKQPLKVLRLLCEEYAMLCESKNRRKVDKETGQLRTSSRREECPKQSGERDSEKGAKDSLEFRLKLGEALVHTARDCGELLPHCADTLLAAVLSNAHDPHPLIRASALSNLAEICQLLGYSFGRIHHEVYTPAFLPSVTGCLSIALFPGTSLHTHMEKYEEKDGESEILSLDSRCWVDVTPLSLCIYDAERGVATYHQHVIFTRLSPCSSPASFCVHM